MKRRIFLMIMLTLLITLFSVIKVNAKGLFDAKLGKGQIFDVQRSPITDGYEVFSFKNPFDASVRSPFNDVDLNDRYFKFKIENRTTNKVGLYIYNYDDTPVSASDLIQTSYIGSNGLVAVGEIVCAGEQGLLYISDFDYYDLGYFVANSMGFSNGDNFTLYCTENPTIEDLESYLYNDVPLLADQYSVMYIKNTTDIVTNMPDTQIKEKDISLTLRNEIPQMLGYEFIGWNTKADGTGNKYQPNDSYTKNEPLVLYAIFELANINNNPKTGDVNILLITITSVIAMIGLVFILKNNKTITKKKF